MKKNLSYSLKDDDDRWWLYFGPLASTPAAERQRYAAAMLAAWPHAPKWDLESLSRESTADDSLGNNRLDFEQWRNQKSDPKQAIITSISKDKQ
jgi:hypothetical protein